MNDIKSIFQLLGIPGIGPRRILNLIQKFKSVERVFEANYQELCDVPGIDQHLAKIIKTTDTEIFVNKQLEYLDKSPFKVTTIFDSQYPERLKNIYDPPIVIYHLGDFREEDFDSIAIVGTRTPTSYGKSVTETLVKELIEQKFTIVSGFARGIDTIAHKAAILSGGRSIAVLGNSIDQVYPPENRNLKNLIVQNGVYCSEFPFSTKPDAVNFPRRNRIISGLSIGVVVIEAGEKSGAILTAYYAVDQNRDIFAIPGRIGDKKSVGTNKLIQKGAKLVTNIDDILTEIDHIRKFPVNTNQMQLDFKLDGAEKAIFEHLSSEPVNIDTLAESLKKSPFEILPFLLNLEIKGCVRQLAGKMFIRA